MIWGYYVSPMMYGQNAIAINEFLDDRWGGVSFLKSLLICSYTSIITICSLISLDHRLKLLSLTKHFILSLEQPPINSTQPTVGKALLSQRGLYTTESWYWICVAALFGFSLIFNLMFIAALTYLNRKFNNFHSSFIYFYDNGYKC